MIVQELLSKLGFTVDPTGIQKGEQLLGGFKRFVVGLGIGASVAMVGKMALDSAAQMETLNAQFTTMLGSAEAAKIMMEDMNSFAARTPFETMDVASAGSILMGFQVPAGQVMDTLDMLGNVAGANSQKFQSLALVYGQVQSAGRLMGGDLLQLINAGFNPLQVISKQTGRSMVQLKKDMEDGRISAEMVTAAFKQATSKGGMFYNNLANQAKTWQGVTSTAIDNFKMSLTDAILPFMPLLKAIVAALGTIDLSPIVAQFAGMATGGEDLAAVVVDLANTLVQLVAAGVAVVRWFLDLAPTVKTMTTVFKALYPALLLVFGPRMLAMIKATTIGTRAAAAAQLFMQRSALAAGAAAGYQATMSSVASTAMYTMKTAAIGAGAAMKTAFLGLLSPMNLVLMGIVGIWMAYNKIKSDISEELNKVANEGMDDLYLAMGGPQYVHQLEKQLKFEKEALAAIRAKALAGEAIDRKKLDKARENMQSTQNQLKVMKDAERRLYGEDVGSDLAASAMAAASGAVAGVQQTVQSTGKKYDIKNELNMSVSAPGGAGGKTGLTAKQVIDLSQEAVKGMFNMQLKDLIVGAV